MFVDTQIISSMWKGVATNTCGSSISSVVANEFLEVYSKNKINKLNYIIPYIDYSFAGAHYLMRNHVLRSISHIAPRHTDKVIIDFGCNHPIIIEYCGKSIANILNNRDLCLFKRLISRLNKEKQRTLIDRFKFISGSHFCIVPYISDVNPISTRLFRKFVEKNRMKVNFRNSVNDILILSIAIYYRERLETRDDLLSRFASEIYDAPIARTESGILVDFSSKPSCFEGRRGEMRDYFNSNWRISDFRRCNPF